MRDGRSLIFRSAEYPPPPVHFNGICLFSTLLKFRPKLVTELQTNISPSLGLNVFPQTVSGELTDWDEK